MTRTRLSRLVTGLVAGTALALTAGTLTASSAAADEVRPATGGSFTVVGHGYGHGIGMSQWGAQSRALAGQDHRTILDFYYPGTSVGNQPDRTLRVGLTGFANAAVAVYAPTAAQLTISSSAQKITAGQRLVVAPNGAGLRGGVDGGWSEDWGGTVSVSGPDGVLLQKGDGTFVRYDGVVRIVTGPRLTVVNDVPLETYLRGVVPAESPASWHAEALRAQAVAARSYAMSVLNPQAQTDICDTTACQVYRGAESRDAAGRTTWTTPASTDAAIAATAGEIRSYGGKVAFTQFSSSNGGWTVAGSKPYLVAAQDPYSAPGRSAPGDGVANWTTTAAASAFNAGCAPGGTVTGIVVTSRDGRGDQGGRVTAGNLVCTNGTVAVTGTKLRQLGGLRSDWFSIVSAVQLHYTALGGSAGPLGAALGAELTTPDGRGAYQHYAGGSIYASPATGAHEVRGAIRSWACWAGRTAWGSRRATPLPGRLGLLVPHHRAQAVRGAILQSGPRWAGRTARLPAQRHPHPQRRGVLHPLPGRLGLLVPHHRGPGPARGDPAGVGLAGLGERPRLPHHQRHPAARWPRVVHDVPGRLGLLVAHHRGPRRARRDPRHLGRAGLGEGPPRAAHRRRAVDGRDPDPDLPGRDPVLRPADRQGRPRLSPHPSPRPDRRPVR